MPTANVEHTRSTAVSNEAAGATAPLLPQWIRPWQHISPMGVGQSTTPCDNKSETTHQVPFIGYKAFYGSVIPYCAPFWPRLWT